MSALQLIPTLLVLNVPSWSQASSNCNSIYEVRLEGKPKCSNGGNLEICWRNDTHDTLRWRKVCSGRITEDDASLVCRLLGFNGTTGHRPVSYPTSCMNSIRLQNCPNTATSVQNCSFSRNSRINQAFGVICSVSHQEMQSCLSAHFPVPPIIISPSTCLQPTTTTTVTQCTPSPLIITPSEATATYDCIPQNTPFDTDPSINTSTAQSSQISSLFVTQENSPSSSNEESASHRCPVELVGIVLGTVIGILATVLVGLLIGCTYYHRRSKSQKVIEGPSNSHFNNPTYDTTTSPCTTSMSNQQTTPNTFTTRNEEGQTGSLYNVLKRPSAEEQYQHTNQLQGREDDEGRDYDVIGEDAMGLSYEVPITRNTREGLEEDDYQEPQDHLRNVYQ